MKLTLIWKAPREFQERSSLHFLLRLKKRIQPSSPTRCIFYWLPQIHKQGNSAGQLYPLLFHPWNPHQNRSPLFNTYKFSTEKRGLSTKIPQVKRSLDQQPHSLLQYLCSVCHLMLVSPWSFTRKWPKSEKLT